ncbi:hypothetical protein MWU65_09130 [Cellulophaga sp. F20128]|uniref:HYC_CC_PP family protein n=1 Tax=Cellulophaga sp. F20128 TaxID=2926413 RepID=UPI001FF64D13|nr:hypothetical protein [Cellulophaga sp. F20128]MCK0157338.1 hypothetical protein [Cellulophaga sp. F20128]
MIKQLVHKVLSVVLVFLVLASTMSFAIEKHFCGGELVGVTLFLDEFDCIPIGCEPANEVVENHCCQGVVDVVKGLDRLTAKAIDHSNIQQKYFLANTPCSFIAFLSNFEHAKQLYANYSPPERIVEIHILDQVFII